MLSTSPEVDITISVVEDAARNSNGVCDAPCPGDSTMSCGGRTAIDVYRTNILGKYQ